MTNLMKASEYYQKGDFRRATKIYEALRDKNPTDALAYQGLGRCYLHTSRIDDAYTASTKALELDEQLSVPFITLGSIYLIKNQLDEAEQMVQRVLDIDSNQADAYIVLGQIKLKNGQVKECISALQKAIELNPMSWNAHYILGLVYDNQMSRRDALKELWIAFRLSPTKKRTGYALLSLHSFVYLTEYGLIMTILGAIAMAVRSVFAWPLILIPSSFFLFIGHLLWRLKRYRVALTTILFGIALIVFYAYYVYALPPFFR
jgi:tetratricopeptide (TPR) repeat protein